MRKLFTQNMRYPKTAEKQGIGGKIIVQYAVDTFGNTIDVKIIKGVRDDLDKEAIRLIKLLKDWIPATLNGHKTTHYLMQPFTFRTGNQITFLAVKQNKITHKH